ncbi:hypothetical protein ABTW95_28305 [Spirillospora sp. NPDC127506]|jgi:hypothetical protein
MLPPLLVSLSSRPYISGPAVSRPEPPGPPPSRGGHPGRYGIYASPREVFQEKYADRVEGYFDGTTPGPVIIEGLPDTLGELLTPRGSETLRHPSGAFAEALRVDAEVCTAWTPRVPVRLCKEAGDEQAATANTDHCAARLRRRGVDVPVVDVGDTIYGGSRHLGSNLAGTARIVRWFAALS